MFPKKHPYYYYGYVYEHISVAYTCINGKNRQTTKIPFALSNRDELLTILEKRIKDYFDNNALQSDTKVQTVSQLIIDYTKIKYVNRTKEYIMKHNGIVKQAITKDFNLTDYIGIRHHIFGNLQTLGNSANTLRKKLEKLKALFQYAIECNYMTVNPIIKQMFPQSEISTRKSVERDTLDLIITKLKENNDIELWLFIRFLKVTGARRIEAVRLRWADINDDYINILGKGNKPRQFPIKPFPELLEILTELRELNSGENVFSFVTPDAVGSMYRKRLRKWDLYEAGDLFHAIRKRCENDLREIYRFEFDDIAAILGHTRQVQEKHYLENFKYDDIASRMLETIEKVG